MDLRKEVRALAEGFLKYSDLTKSLRKYLDAYKKFNLKYPLDEMFNEVQKDLQKEKRLLGFKFKKAQLLMFKRKVFEDISKDRILAKDKVLYRVHLEEQILKIVNEMKMIGSKLRRGLDALMASSDYRIAISRNIPFRDQVHQASEGLFASQKLLDASDVQGVIASVESADSELERECSSDDVSEHSLEVQGGLVDSLNRALSSLDAFNSRCRNAMPSARALHYVALALLVSVGASAAVPSVVQGQQRPDGVTTVTDKSGHVVRKEVTTGGSTAVLDKRGDLIRRELSSDNGTVVLDKDGNVVRREYHNSGNSSPTPGSYPTRSWKTPEHKLWRDPPPGMTKPYLIAEFYYHRGMVHKNHGVTVYLNKDLQRTAFNMATGYYRLHLKKHPNDGKAWNRLGDALQMMKLYDKAVDAYKKAVKINPKDGNAYGGLGYCLLMAERGQEAKVALEKAIELGETIAKRNYDWAKAKGKFK